jgi:hypothetical protein
MSKFIAIWLVPLLGAGCGGVVGKGSLQVSPDEIKNNGPSLNGVQPDEIKNNGPAMQATGVDLSLAGRLTLIPPVGGTGDLSEANQTPLPAALSGSTLYAASGGAPLSTNGLVIPATFFDGTTQVNGQAYIEGEPWADATDGSIKYYNVREHYVALDGSDVWAYLCGTTSRTILIGGQLRTITTPVPATAVAGQWDYHQGSYTVNGATVPGGSKVIEMIDSRSSHLITFACMNGAIGKCVGMGYAPWESAPSECAGSQLLGNYRCLNTSKEMMHEACVRMVRADYCGDGVAHTLDGTSIDYWDPDRIMNETPYGASDTANTVPYGHEAEWTPKGARCLSQLLMTRVAGGHYNGTRLDGISIQQYLTTYCPNRWQYDNDNSSPFSWTDEDCFGTDSTFNFSNVSWSKLANGNSLITMDMHDRVWLRNKSVCVDDSYDHTATSAPSVCNVSTGKCTPSPNYSPWPSNYNQDRYLPKWCKTCLVDRSLPYAGTCGVAETYD